MVHEQALPAGLGMGADHRMDALGRPPDRILAHADGASGVQPGLRTCDADVAVDDAKAGQHRLHAVGEAFVGEVLIGEQRVAAIGRHVERIEDGAHRRLRHHRRVGVPLFADDPLVARLAHDADDLGVAFAGIEIGMDEDIAEAAGEGLVAGIVDLLAAKEDHQMLEQRASDFGDRRLVEAGADIQAADLGTQGAGDRRDGDALVIGHVCNDAGGRPTGQAGSD